MVAVAPWVSLLATLQRAPIHRRSEKRSFSLAINGPALCTTPCSSSSLSACSEISDAQARFDCWCSYANLQTLAQCTTCVQANAGQIIVNGTTVDPDTFMSDLLDACYDDGYVIPASVYSSISGNAGAYATGTTVNGAAPSATATGGTSGGSSSSSAATPTTSISSTAPNANLNSTQGLTAGVCTANFFSDIDPAYGICIYQGMVLQPHSSSTCSGSSCSWAQSDTKACGGGICSGILVPSQMTCDNTLRDTTYGMSIPQLQAANLPFGGVGYYICNCNGPTDSIPTYCGCGSNCEQVLAPVSNLQCNVAISCLGGASYNPVEQDSNTCLKPNFAVQNSSGVFYVTDTSGSVISCHGDNDPLSSCGNLGGSSQGTRVCSCSDSNVANNACNLASTGSGSSNSTNGGSSSSSAGGGQGSSSQVSAGQVSSAGWRAVVSWAPWSLPALALYISLAQ